MYILTRLQDMNKEDLDKSTIELILLKVYVAGRLARY